VTNLLRVLSLPESVQQMVEQGTLSVGHARALLALAAADSVAHAAEESVARAMSVRQLEQYVRELNGSPAPASSAKHQRTEQQSPQPASLVRSLEDSLRRYLQTDVRVQLSGEAKGRIEIAFYSNDDLDRLLELILREHRNDF
jgi:ParB family chromosome partitioning protein